MNCNILRIFLWREESLFHKMLVKHGKFSWLWQVQRISFGFLGRPLQLNIKVWNLLNFCNSIRGLLIQSNTFIFKRYFKKIFKKYICICICIYFVLFFPNFFFFMLNLIVTDLGFLCHGDARTHLCNLIIFCPENSSFIQRDISLYLSLYIRNIFLYLLFSEFTCRW